MNPTNPTTPRCDCAPPGWQCVRDAGHDGSCAATPIASGVPALLDISDLGPDERRVIGRIVERMRLGFTRYGALDIAASPKDWRAEATEEFLDGAVYLAMQSIRERG